MRITNTMMINTSLLNLNRGLEKLQSIDKQVHTGKKISNASENPLIAGKSIRYNTRLYEIDQYRANVSAANSWLKSSETAMDSTSTALARIRELIEQCASETLTDDDRAKNQIEIQELRSQISEDANSNVSGRYLFSGFKTNEKVIFDTNVDKQYNLNEQLDYTKATKVLADDTGIKESYSIKLLYGNISDVSFTVGNDLFPDETATPPTVIQYKSQNEADAYDPPKENATTGPTVNIIIETGEIVFEKSYYEKMNSNINVNYNKIGFSKNEMNPIHFLKCSEKKVLSQPVLGNMDGNKMSIDAVGGIKQNSIRGLKINGNSIIADDGTINPAYTVNYTKSTDLSTVAANEIRINSDTGEIVVGDDLKDGSIVLNSYYNNETSPFSTSKTETVYFNNLQTFKETAGKYKINNKGVIDNNSIGSIKLYMTDGTDSVITNISYTNSSDTTPVGATEARVNMDTGEIILGSSYTGIDHIDVDKFGRSVTEQSNEEIKYEINTNSKITVNTLCSDLYTPDMIKDLDLIINRIVNFDRDKVTELSGKTMTAIDKHLDQLLKQQSIVGSKMNRLTMIDNKLNDDSINVKDLKSENENIDEAEALTNLAMQELVYNAALNATSRVLQKSLLDFI